jgi:uncharacterized membrane protein
MSALSPFERASLKHIRDLEVSIVKENLKAQEEAYKAQLEHDFNMRMIKMEFTKRKKEELLRMRRKLEDELLEIDSLLDSL